MVNIKKIERKRMEEIIETTVFYLTPNERDIIISTIITDVNVGWALNLLSRYIPEDDKPLTNEEKNELKNLVLNNSNAEEATFAVINLSNNFSKEELDKLRNIAYSTTNEYSAYALYNKEWSDLITKKEIRDTLRQVIVSTKDTHFAFKMLEVKDDNIALHNEGLESLNLSQYEIDAFKKMIINGEDPESAYRLLVTKETAEEAEEEKNSNEDYFPRQTYSIIELTENERIKLKRIIIESQDSEWAYMAFNHVKGVTDGEKMVLKGIIMRTTNPDFACFYLCDTNFISNLSKDERDYLKKLAVQTKNWWFAKDALIYIFDLTPEERSRLEKLAKTAWEQKKIE